jgi:hypothetical protein
MQNAQKIVAIHPIVARSSFQPIVNTICGKTLMIHHNPHDIDIIGFASGENPNINAKVNVELCGVLEHSKYYSNYPPNEI